MLTHDQIMKATLLAVEEDYVVDYDAAKKQTVLVMTKAACNSEYYNLLRASAMLYQTIEQQFKGLESLIELCEELGADGIIPCLLNMQQGLYLAKRIAVEGAEAVAKSLPNTDKGI